MSNETEKEENEAVVPIKMKLLSVDEVFVYRIPPLRSAGGHRAEDWDLAKPLRTCSLLVERDDHDTCFIRLDASNALFALCVVKFDETKTKMEHFVETVMDSSRYFVVRISDGTRQASIGMGFRERDDASNFRLALQDWEQSLQREKTAQKLHEAYEEQHTQDHAETTNSDGTRDSTSDALSAQASRLTLKEGETIHVNLKGASSGESRKSRRSSGGGAAIGGSAVPLLKKPPPSPMKQPSPPLQEETNKTATLNKAEESGDTTTSTATSEVGSECAVASLTDDEEWNDFESSSQYD